MGGAGTVGHGVWVCPSPGKVTDLLPVVSGPLRFQSFLSGQRSGEWVLQTGVQVSCGKRAKIWVLVGGLSYRPERNTGEGQE